MSKNIFKNLRGGGGLNELLKLSFSSRVDFSQPSHFIGRLKSTLLSNDKKPAFTLAEVLLVLVILGVIAAITMPTLNLSGNKEKALNVKGMKVLGDIDKALDLIKFNDSNGSLLSIYDPYDSSKTISISNPNDRDKLKAVFAKYLKITNKPCDDTSTCYCANSSLYDAGISFYLNNGACVGIATLSQSGSWVWFPDSEKVSLQYFCDASIVIDVNGADGPNQKGIDRFKVPVNQDGIIYNVHECGQLPGCVECAPNNPNWCTRCANYAYKGNSVVQKECTYNSSNGTCDCHDVE